MIIEGDEIIMKVNENIELSRINKNEIHGFSVGKSNWFGFCGSKKIYFSKISKHIKLENGSYSHTDFINYMTYINNNDVDAFVKFFKECLPEMTENSLSAIDDKYHINQYILSNNNSTAYRSNISGMDILELKFQYDKRNFFGENIFVAGANENIFVSGVKKNDIEVIRKYLISKGAKIGADCNVEYKDIFTLNVIWSPKLWFTKSSIGVSDDGLVFSQKTFKTNDSIFLPYDKISLIVANSKWYYFGAKKITIDGEQNIMPDKAYSLISYNAIKKVLEKNGVKPFDGDVFKPAVPQSGLSAVLCITIVYYFLLLMFSSLKRKNQVVVSSENKKVLLKGKIFGCLPGESNLFSYKRIKSKYVISDINDVNAVVYVKKKWFHLWGYMYIIVEPKQLRSNIGANQDESIYLIRVKKVWTSTAKSLASSVNKSLSDDKNLKKWAKSLMDNKDM